MRPVLRILLGAIAVAVVIGGAIQMWHGFHGMFGASETATLVDNNRLAAIRKAAGDFQALAKGSADSGQPPRQTDPKVAALLAPVFDTAVLKAGPPATTADLDNLKEWSLQIVNVGGTYMLAGTGITDLSKLGKVDAAQQQKVSEKVSGNMVAFAPELGRYLDAELGVTSALIGGVQAQISANPSKWSGPALDQIRMGYAQVIAGALGSLPISGLSDEWRRDRLPALNASVAGGAAFLTPDQRHSLHAMTLQVAAGMTDPAMKSGLTAMAKALA